jgi:hypothetical protein
MIAPPKSLWTSRSQKIRCNFLGIQSESREELAVSHVDSPEGTGSRRNGCGVAELPGPSVKEHEGKLIVNASCTGKSFSRRPIGSTGRNARAWLVPLAVLPSLVALQAAAMADNNYGTPYASPRQYYSDWKQYPSGNAYYRDYYYKPTPTYAGYKHHYVVLYPSHPDRAYFYNPYKKTYWGYCPSGYSGEEQESAYSHLPAEYQKNSLAEIPDSAFPPLGKLPAIPDSKDGARLDLPPDDLPPGFGAARGAVPPAPAP